MVKKRSCSGPGNRLNLDLSLYTIRRIPNRRIRETDFYAEVLIADAKESLRLAEERHGNCVGTILDLLDAQVSLTCAEANGIEAPLSHRSAYSLFLLEAGSL